MRRNKEQKILYYTSNSFFEKKYSEMEESEERVCFLLSKEEELRNSDERLIERYREEYGKDGATESITRARRKIQNDLGLYLPTDPDVMEKRKIGEDAVRSWASTNINQRRETIQDGWEI